MCESPSPVLLFLFPCTTNCETLTEKSQTDDVGVFGSPLSNEYKLVAEHFGLTQPQIHALARKSIEVIFAGPEEKQRLRDIMDGYMSRGFN